MSRIRRLLRPRRGRATPTVLAAVAAASASLLAGPAGAASPSAAGDGDTATPIKHVVVIVGENHTFDNVFATYRPPAGEHVDNLLSEGIVNASGGAGPHASKALQSQATDTSSYQVDPTSTTPYTKLPPPNTTYVSKPCSGQDQNVADSRFPSLDNVPYQITKYVPYFDDHGQYQQFGTCEFNGAVVGDPLHRFYQMYQEVSGDQQHPGGTNDLWTWVHQTAGDSNGDSPAQAPIHQGALEMGYYNMAAGDAPILRYLADHYAMSDDYHQSVMGGTGANHIMLGTGDAAFFQTPQGQPTAPPAGEVENPNPQPGTNNFYTQDGYGKSGTKNGGSYSNCSDSTQPGVSSVDAFLGTLSYKTFNNGDCAPGHYYLLNNYNPGYNVDGSLNKSTFTVPPQQTTNTVADELQAKHISWGYFGEGYNDSTGTVGPNYCGICDPFQYATSVMTNSAKRANVQHGLGDFDSAVANNSLPAVSYLKPGDDDGHPGYSTLAAYENFVSHAVTEIQNQPKLWKSTAIFVTMDEGGGYYDSGAVQPVSFFGDGTRVPMLVVSPYTRAGHVDHSYADHVSTLKFIEANWKLSRLSSRSLDNLPNPQQKSGSYLPQNPPAISDLMGLFDFGQAQTQTSKPPPGKGPQPQDSGGGGSGGGSKQH
jgi:phospholipase C